MEYVVLGSEEFLVHRGVLLNRGQLEGAVTGHARDVAVSGLHCGDGHKAPDHEVFATS